VILSMALSPSTYQFVTQLGPLRYIDASTGPDGPHGVTSYWLVPSGGWHNGQRFPHTVQQELEGEKFNKETIEGVEYFLIPESSTNTPGRLSHYAQLTGVAELQNPSGGGVNRVRETLENTAEATVAPDEVSKYVKENDSYEEARKKQSQADAQLASAISGSPAREPSEGKLVTGSGDESGSTGGNAVKSTGGSSDAKPAQDANKAS